jgi:hypothetical protein
MSTAKSAAGLAPSRLRTSRIASSPSTTPKIGQVMTGWGVTRGAQPAQVVQRRDTERRSSAGCRPG